MSQGAIFKIVVQDDRFDSLITASRLLQTRLSELRRGGKLPTISDIGKTHIMYMYDSYQPHVAIASEYNKVKPFGDGTSYIGPASSTIEFAFPAYGNFTSDMFLHIKLKPIGSDTATTPTVTNPLFRFCAYPGVKLLKKVRLNSAQLVIDEYSPDDVIANSKFFLTEDQKAGWNTCMGQQTQKEAIYYANSFTGQLTYMDGAQTPKLYHESLELFIPLQFWFCKDPSHALLNDLFVNSQRTITCELAPIHEIIKAVVPNIIDPAILDPVDLPLSRIGMEANLYVNGLYVNSDIHEIFTRKIGFSLIRVHRSQTFQIRNEMGSFLLDQLKFPAEYLMTGVRSKHMNNDFDRWWLMGTPKVRTRKTKLLIPTLVWNATENANQLVWREPIESSTLESMIETIGITTHGVEIFPSLPGAFYNAYMPIRYTENEMAISPKDTSAFLINFCLHPGQFNPSGHYNLSASREMYINYTLKHAYASSHAEMLISMSAINFLVRNGDNIELRYTV